MFTCAIITGIGKIRVISISKIKKIRATRKNRNENGIRDFLLGSNPHSKADGFSRCWISFLVSKEFKVIRIIGSTNEIKKICVIILI